MSSQNNDAIEKLMYGAIGAIVCCSFMPSYIGYIVCGGTLILCAYGIIYVLEKDKNIDDMNFVEKEKVEYFKKK